MAMHRGMRSCSQLQLHLKSFLPLRFDAYEVLFRDAMPYQRQCQVEPGGGEVWGRCQLIYNLNLAKVCRLHSNFPLLSSG